MINYLHLVELWRKFISTNKLIVVHRTSQIRILLILTLLSCMALMAFQNQSYRPANFEPIFMTRAEMETSTTLMGPRAIESPGKIWIYGNYILLVEEFRGIHIIDNSDPNNSQSIAFIRVDGCVDIAMSDGIIFANNAVDMIGIRGNSAFDDVEVISRNRNILPRLTSPEPLSDWYFINQLPEDMIIVRWIPI